MPNIKSQIKRVKTNNKANEINTAKKSRVRNAVKKYREMIDAKDIAGAEAYLPSLVALIDSSMSDGLYTRENASRKISRLSKALTDLKAE